MDIYEVIESYQYFVTQHECLALNSADPECKACQRDGTTKTQIQRCVRPLHRLFTQAIQQDPTLELRLMYPARTFMK